MKTTAFVSHADCSRHDTGWGHPDHQGRLPALMRHVYRDMLTLFDPLLEVEARPAEEAALLRAHTPGHLRRVREAVEAAARAGRPIPMPGGPVVSGASWDAAVAAAGAAITGAEMVLAGEVRNAFCAARPPGNEAGRDGPGGFSLFGNVAVAALHLVERMGLARVLVLECGGGFGSGSAEILGADGRVRFLSVHQGEPGEAGPSPHVTLPPGATLDPYLAALRGGLDRVLRDGWRPEFLLVSLGFDSLASDPLGTLALQPADFHALTVWLRERAEELCGGRLAAVLEGGYDADGSGRAAVQHLRALAGLPPA